MVAEADHAVGRPCDGVCMIVENPDGPTWALPMTTPAQTPPAHEGVWETPDGYRIRLIAATQEALVATAERMDAIDGLLRPWHPGEETGSAHILEEVAQAVAELEGLLQGLDAFDVMTLLAQYLVPPDLSLWKEGESGSAIPWSAAEVVALVTLGMGLPVGDPDSTIPPARVIPEVAAVAGEVVTLATFNAMTKYSQLSASADLQEGLPAMAFRLSTHETVVRGRQYPTLASEINDAVLRTPQTDAAFIAELGFVYDDVITVRQGVIDHLNAARQRAMDVLAGAVKKGGPPDRQARVAARGLFQSPSELHQVTGSQVAKRVGLDLDRVDKVLGAFSASPDGRTPLELVTAFVDGLNPIAGRAILHRHGQGYLPLPGMVALDEIRRTCEGPLKGTGSWTRYGRARDKAVENLVADTLADMLDGRATTHRNLTYRDAQSGHDLTAESVAHSSAPVAEVDCLLVLDGVALCVEVKAGDLRPRSRQGGVRQLQGDLEKIVKSAARQADRARQLIENNRGLWTQAGEWIDLAEVREIHTLIVTLDDLGPLSLSTSDLVRSGVLPQVALPWLVSVHDLLVTRDVLDRPEQFLTYLRRRTTRDAALWITGSDELDLLMWYVSGGFYFVPDPERLYALHPGSKRPTSRQIREYAEQGRTLVGTFTDPLDAYYYWLDGSSSQEAERPRRAAPPLLLDHILKAMREREAPGYLRFGADLDGYSWEAQQRLTSSLTELLKSSRHDGQVHTLTQGGTDNTGSWVHIFAAGPDTRRSREHLRQYVTVKKHQQHADRALAMHLAADGSPLFSLWLAHAHEDDPELDRLARAMRLVPSDRAPDSIPPKAKITKRPRRKKRSKKRRR